MSVFLKIFGIIFLIYGLLLSVLSNINFGLIAVLVLGVLFLTWGIFYEQVSEWTSSGLMRAVKYAIITAICAGAGLAGFIAVYGLNDNVTYKEDAVIVLGAAVHGERITMPLKYRLDKAIEYSSKNPDAVIVVTGGQGFQETVSEAYAMEKYLADNGVGAERIIKEEEATSTKENMRFSKALLDARLDAGYTVAVITNNFHIFRGVSLAKSEGFTDVSHMGAELQWYNLLPCYFRECFAVLKMWVLG